MAQVHFFFPFPDAPSVMQAMWLMLQRDKPEDYVIATGESHSVRELVELAFQEVDIEIVYVEGRLSTCGCFQQ